MMEDAFSEHPLPASRTVVAKAIITTLLLFDIYCAWGLSADLGADGSLPAPYGLTLIAIFTLTLGWLHLRPGMTGAKPAVISGWIVGSTVAIGWYTLTAISWSPDEPLADLTFYAIASTQMLIPISVRWAQKADETFWMATKRVMTVVVIAIGIALALRYS